MYRNRNCRFQYTQRNGTSIIALLRKPALPHTGTGHQASRSDAFKGGESLPSAVYARMIFTRQGTTKPERGPTNARRTRSASPQSRAHVVITTGVSRHKPRVGVKKVCGQLAERAVRFVLLREAKGDRAESCVLAAQKRS